MDDRTPFEGRLARALDVAAGSVRPVDAARIARQAAALGRVAPRAIDPRPRWLAAAAAVAVVAVGVGGLALVQRPAAVVPGASASPGTSAGPESESPWFLFEGGPRGQATLYVARADGSDVRAVVTSDDIANAQWSPDGTRIGYGAVEGSWTTIDLGDGSIRRVPAATQDCGGPAWSQDGTRIAYFEDPCASLERDTGQYVDLVMERVDGTGATRLERARGSSFPEVPAFAGWLDRPLAWSPDGARIALACRDDRDRAILGVCVADMDDAVISSGTFTPVRLETAEVVPSDWVWTDLVWSPDGRWLAAVARPPNANRAKGVPGTLVAVPVEGGAPVVLATGDERSAPGRPHKPAWTPDGASLVYYAYRDAYLPHGASWIVGADGQGPRQLAIPVGYSCAMAPSPDGSILLAGSFYADGTLFLGTPDERPPHTYVTAGQSDDGTGSACPAWQPAPAPIGDALPVASPLPKFSDTDPRGDAPPGM